MNSVLITGPNNVQENIIKELHNLKVLHIVEHSKSELADIGKPLQNASYLSEILVKVRALMSTLRIKKEDNKFELKKGMLEVESTTKKLNEEISSNFEEFKKIEGLLSKNKALMQELEILKDIDMGIENFTTYKSLAYFTGYLKDKNSVSAIKVELSLTTTNFMLTEYLVRNKVFIILFIDIKNRESASYVLQKHGFTPMNLTQIYGLKGSARNNLNRIGQETKQLQERFAEIKGNIDSLHSRYKGFLIASDDFLSEQLEKAEAPLKFAATSSSFLIKGWVPNEELNKTIQALNKAAGNKIFIHFDKPKKEDKVPVKLNNPKFAKSFEFFIDLYSTPTYKEIDPTFFIFFTFPIFFGIMLGDVGYGLLSLILFYILKKSMPKAKNFSNILLLASFVTILFGFLFGEFFGFEFVHPVISREHEMFTLLYIAIAIGVIHVNIGLIIGFINELRSHGLRHAFFAKISWFVLEVGILIVALSIFKIISFSLFGLSSLYIPFIGPITMTTFVGISIIILSLSMLFIGEGIKGPIEAISLLTNTMSYARLMAIGLSSVILAVIINDSSKEFFHKGGFFILIGVLILIIGHAINIMLGLLGSFLHSLRLHYVEFFSKFFHGGAKKYQPFGARE